MKKLTALTAASLLISSLTFSTAFAFSDVEEGQAEAVSALQKRGVVSGMDKEHFVPKGKVSYAQGMQMIVKGLDLNLDLMRFVKKPEASDIYTNISDNAWYAEAFIIAHYNGLDIPKDVNPNATITREQFASLLMKAVELKGRFPMIKLMAPLMKDENQITPEYQGALMRMVHYKIVELDKNGNFNPKAELTRGEAAVWVHHAIKVKNEHAQPQAPEAADDVAVSIEKVSDDVNKVTLSRGEKPTAGYSIEINSIVFGKEGQAVITYTLHDPQPDAMNAEMITQPKAATYVSSQYIVTAQPAALK